MKEEPDSISSVPAFRFAPEEAPEILVSDLSTLRDWLSLIEAKNTEEDSIKQD